MTHLTGEMRKDAGRYDSTLARLFDCYVSEKDEKKKKDLELEIETTLIQMSANVNQRCYDGYKEIYYTIKDMRCDNG